MEWDTVIGLEVHAQLSTASKLFSTSSTSYGASANAHTSFIDAGLPGVLPVLNEEAVRLAIKFGLATHAKINDLSSFERKNYFYPDLPKGYQISQFQKPIISHGYINISSDQGDIKKIEIVRAHLEEDAGKSIHDNISGFTGVDLNRAGIPLLEIVTTPCLSSAAEAVRYLKKLHQLLRFLEICDGNMQEGSFRCDVNISLKKKGAKELGTRTELKNINSFRYIEKAIQYEQSRQMDLLESGHPVTQETRLYSVETGKTMRMRSKEEENDYRYFPDPDLLPVHVSNELIDKVKSKMPELPSVIESKLTKNKTFSEEDIQFLLSSPATYQFYNDTKSNTKADEKLILNWLKGPFASLLKDNQINLSQSPISAETIGKLLDAISNNLISNHIAKSILDKLLLNEEAVDKLITEASEQQSGQEENLKLWVKEVINKHPEQVAEYKSGKEKLLGFFVGQVMKKAKGKADPAVINQYIKDFLN
jgi:aspartyl-tRNA(Asn)/glutamyl-tRNA(Gln) amidotransferase subunit B